MYFTTVYLQLIATSLKYDLTILTFCLKCLLTTSFQYRHFQVQNLTSSMSESDLEEVQHKLEESLGQESTAMRMIKQRSQDHTGTNDIEPILSKLTAQEITTTLGTVEIYL